MNRRTLWSPLSAATLALVALTGCDLTAEEGVERIEQEAERGAEELRQGAEQGAEELRQGAEQGAEKVEQELGGAQDDQG